MLIGEIAKKTGFSTDTIRWYEKIGLLQLDKKTRGKNNYRVYDKKALDRLIAIRSMKTLGFTLKETEDLLVLENTDDLNCENVSPIIDAKVELIDQKIAELNTIKSKLNLAKSRCNGDCAEVICR